MRHCYICSRNLASHGLCSNCWSNLTWKVHKLNHSWIYSLFFYDKSALSLIHLFKYKSPWLWRNLLVSWFRLIYSDMIKSCDILIPIAMHRKKLASRGYNQIVILTRALAQSFNKKCLVNNLIKSVNSQSQTLLRQEERLKNVKDTFFIKNPHLLYQKKLLLIDDVVTTGATMGEARTVLSKATDQILGLTIAST